MAASHPSTVRNSQASYSKPAWIAALALVTITVCAYAFRDLAASLAWPLGGLSTFSLIHILSGGRLPAGPPMMLMAFLAGTALVSSASAAPPSQTIVYTSNLPPNWDLYLFEGDGQPRRLTDHPALDYNPALSSDGRWLVFCSERDGSPDLWLLDLRQDGPARRLTGAGAREDAGALEDAPAFSPDGARLAFVSTRDGEAGIYVSPFRALAGELGEAVLLTPEPGGDFNPAFSPDGKRMAFSSNRDVERGSQVYIMDADGSNVIQLTDGEGWNGSPVWSTDGRTIYYHSASFAGPPRFSVATSSVWQVNRDGGEPRRLTSPDGLAAWPAVTDDGRLTYSVRGEGFWRIAAHGEDGYQILVENDGDLWAPIVAGGRTFAYGPGPIDEGLVQSRLGPFIASEGRSRSILGDHTLDLQPLRHPFPVPDPQRRRWATAIGALSVSNLDGGARHAVYRPEKATRGWAVWAPSWSPDGDWIAAAVGPGFAPPQAPVDVWKVRPDGSGAVNLTASPTSNDGFPNFSPDGREIVFRSGRDGNHEIYLMDADGGNVRRLTDHEATDTMPVFSPRGDQIAFVSERDGDFELYTLDLGAGGAIGEPRRITDSPGRDMHPRYSPDGRWLVFATGRYGFNDERSFTFNPQAFGELAALRLADLHVVRLTHNKWEDGLAFWVSESLDEMLAPGRTSEVIAAASSEGPKTGL